MLRCRSTVIFLILAGPAYAGVGDSIGIGALWKAFVIGALIYLVVGGIIIYFTFRKSEGLGWLMMIVFIAAPFLWLASTGH